MDIGIQQERRQSGGITSLAKQILKHREAVEYDLLTKTGHELNDIGRSLSWDALESFFTYIDPNSALMRDLNSELSAWSSTVKTNEILADIADVLMQINANLIAVGSGKKAKKPKPYPRPGKKDKDNERHFGSGPLPPNELRKWFDAKRAKKCRK